MVVTRSESRKHLTEVNEPIPQPEENAEIDMLVRALYDPHSPGYSSSEIIPSPDPGVRFVTKPIRARPTSIAISTATMRGCEYHFSLRL